MFVKALKKERTDPEEMTNAILGGRIRIAFPFNDKMRTIDQIKECASKGLKGEVKEYLMDPAGIVFYNFKVDVKKKIGSFGPLCSF